MSLDEELSRLLAGDLPEPEARALRQRIERDPEVARAHAQMVALVEALSALPETAPAPPLRIAPLRPRSRIVRVAPWLLAAAACAGWLFLSGRDPQILLASGESWVDGDLSLAAGDVTIDLDGGARIRVEPPAAGPRVAGWTEEDAMTRGQVLAGLAGAAVTVAVYQGSAVVRAGTATPVHLAAGDEQAFGGNGVGIGGTSPFPTDRAALESRLAMLERDLAATREALQLEQFSGALTRGQLQAEQGAPSSWPAVVPPTMTADRFKDELTARLAGLSDVEVRDVDCTEYPCIAAVKFIGSDQTLEWGKEATDRIGAWAQEAYGEDHSLTVNRSMFVNDDQQARYIVFAAHADEENADVKAREKWRVDTLVEQLGEEVDQPGGPATPAPGDEK